MSRLLILILPLTVSFAHANEGTPAATPPGCIGSAPLGRFRVTISRPDQEVALPIREVLSVPSSAKLVWDPVHASPRFGKKSEIAVLVVPRGRGNLVVLAPRKAQARAEWDLPQRAEVVALVLGPDGLNINKVKSLVAANEDLLTQLADYAEQASAVESLIQELADSDQSQSGTDAALKGFGSRYGVTMPKLNAGAPTNQQATSLLAAVVPAANAYDPLTSGSAQMEQTGGLAASVAGLFFGSSAGIAAGGVALIGNLGAVLFPNTEFRSAFAQSADAGGLAFCTKNAAAKSRTRIAYLWAYRFPGLDLPVTALSQPAYLPMKSKSTVKLTTAEDSDSKELARAREWRLTPLSGGAAAPIKVALGSTPDSLTLDLTKSKATAGDYRLTADWDWDSVSFGVVHLRPYGDFAHVEIAPASREKLVQGNGVVTVKLTGADFEFVQKAQLEKVAARPAKVVPEVFDLPVGERRGEQRSMDVDIDTAAAGAYHLLLAQSDGVPHVIPVSVLPPNPRLSGLPVRINMGEAEAPLRIQGSGLDRIESLSSEAGTMTGSADGDAWSGKIRLSPKAREGQRFAVVLKIRGLDEPITVQNAILVVGPRPKIVSARESVPPNLGIEMRDKELPAGTSVGLVISVDHLRDPNGKARPRVEITCESGDVRNALTISPDDRQADATLSFAGPDSLYLSVDPGIIGYPGCELAARVTVDPNGSSNSWPLGSVARIPLLTEFNLTNESLSANVYVGILEGRDLDVIEKAGWDAKDGLPVVGIPTPIPGQPSQQTLRIALPWPAPAPHAPLYIWLRGERAGRKTTVTD